MEKNCKICKNNELTILFLCNDCYNKTLKDVERYKISPAHLNRYSYNNIKNYIYKNKLDTIELQKQLYTLCALTIANYKYNNDYKLLENIQYDILKINSYINNKSSFNNEDFRTKWPKEYQCDDGHYVRSLSEQSIDNWLYNNGYIHSYEKSVYMKNNPEEIVLSDFYLPKLNVYIEFWGIIEDEKYLKRKNEKIKLYENNNYQRIDLYEKDIKRLNDIMPRLLGKFIK